MASKPLLPRGKKLNIIAMVVAIIALIFIRINMADFSDIYMSCGKMPDGKPVHKDSHEMTQKDHLHAVQKKMFGKKSEYEKKMDVWRSKDCQNYRETGEFREAHRSYQSYTRSKNSRRNRLR